MSIKQAVLFVCAVFSGLAMIASMLMTVGAVVASGAVIFADVAFSFWPFVAVPAGVVCSIVMAAVAGNLILALRNSA